MTAAVADLDPRAEHTKKLKARDMARVRSMPARAVDKPLPPVRAQTLYVNKPLPPIQKPLPSVEKPLPTPRPIARKPPPPSQKPLPPPIRTDSLRSVPKPLPPPKSTGSLPAVREPLPPPTPMKCLPPVREPLQPIRTDMAEHPHPLRSHPSPPAVRTPKPNYSRPFGHPVPATRNFGTKKPRPHTISGPLQRKLTQGRLPPLPHIKEDAEIHMDIYPPTRRVQVRRIRFMGNRLWLPIVLVFTPTGKMPQHRSSVKVSGLGDHGPRRSVSGISKPGSHRGVRRKGSGISKSRSHRRPKPQTTNRDKYERRRSPSKRQRTSVLETTSSSNTETVVPNFGATDPMSPMTPIENRRRKLPARDTKRDGQYFVFEGEQRGCAYRWLVQEGAGEDRRRKSSIV